MYVCMYACTYAFMYVCMFACMFICIDYQFFKHRLGLFPYQYPTSQDFQRYAYFSSPQMVHTPMLPRLFIIYLVYLLRAYLFILSLFLFYVL